MPRPIRSSTRSFAGPWALRLFLAMLMLFESGDILAMLGYRQPHWRWPSDISTSVVSMGIVALIAARPWPRTVVSEAVRQAWPAWLLLFASALSVRWSVDRQTTISHVWWMIVVGAFAIALVTVRPLALTVDAICLFGTVATLTGLALSLTHASFRSGGAAMGLFGNRNGFGAFLGFTWPSVLLTCRGTPIRRGLALVLVPLWVCAVVETGSRTSIVSMGLVAAMFVLFTARRFLRGVVPSRTLRTTIAAGTVALASLGIAIAQRMGALSFDTTFTSRTVMWRALRTAMVDRGIFGFGSAAFWSGARGHLIVAQNASGLGRELATGHNGWIHEWVALGFAGPVLVTLLIVVLAYRGFRSIEWGSRGQGSFIALTLLALVVQNLTEAMVTHPRSTSWMFWVLLAALPAPSPALPKQSTDRESFS